MTAQPQSRPVRATSWLANWIDYGIAVILVVCRLIRAPFRRSGASQFAPAYAHASDHGAPQRPDWHRAEPQQPQHWLVRPAEILMLSISFFLAAHLLGGGTSEVRAPQVNPLSFLSTPDAATQVRASTVPATGGFVIEFMPPQATTNTIDLTAETTAASEATGTLEAEAQPAPSDGGGASAAEAAATEVTPAPASTPAPEPTPAPTEPPVEPTPVPAAPTQAPAPPAAVPGPSVLGYAAIRDLAIQVGWPADRADEVARVAYCESRFRPGAVGYGTYGLMQLVPLWFSAAGVDFNLWSDPATNLRVALFAFETDMSYGNDAWAPWSCKPWNIQLP